MASSPTQRRYLALPGPPANSPFRLAGIKEAINSPVSNTNKVVSIRSIFIHYVCPQEGVDVNVLEDENSRERKCLDQLLRYGDESSELNRDEETWKLVAYAKGQKEVGFMSNTLVLPVFPRKGTISPWSSKATSIAHVCELGDYIKRIERGVLFSVVFEKEIVFDGVFGGADNVLFDRMTQVGIRPTSRCFWEKDWLELMSVFLFRHVKWNLLVMRSCLGPMSHFRLNRLIFDLLQLRPWRPLSRRIKGWVWHWTLLRCSISLRRSLMLAHVLGTPTTSSYLCLLR